MKEYLHNPLNPEQSDEPVVTAFIDGKQVTEAEYQTVRTERFSKFRDLAAIGLTTIAGIALAFALRTNADATQYSAEVPQDSAVAAAVESTQTPTPTRTTEPINPNAYRTSDPHNPIWAPVGEYWTPTPTKPPGYYTNPDLLTPTTTPEPTEVVKHYPPADYYRWQDPNKAHLWVAVDEQPPTPTPTKPPGYYTNPDLLTPTVDPQQTETQ